MWAAIQSVRKDLAAGLDRKVNSKMFTFVVGSIVFLALAGSAFQWDAITNNKATDRVINETVRIKISEMSEDVAVIKALTIEANEGKDAK